MFREEGGRPGDERGFVHKRILGIVSRVAPIIPIPGAGLIGQLAGAIAKQPARATVPRSTTARPTFAGFQGKQLGRQLKFGEGVSTTGQMFAGPGITCQPPSQLDPRTGRCVVPTPGLRGRLQRFLPGGETGFTPAPRTAAGPVGDAVMGQFGAALQPGIMTIERSVCIPGMQLGKDGLCYNKGAITNSQRMWPRGRRPLLTGGDMRAIGIAARAGAKLERTTKRLRSLGMMKKLPTGHRTTRHQHAKPVAAVSV